MKAIITVLAIAGVLWAGQVRANPPVVLLAPAPCQVYAPQVVYALPQLGYGYQQQLLFAPAYQPSLQLGYAPRLLSADYRPAFGFDRRLLFGPSATINFGARRVVVFP